MSELNNKGASELALTQLLPNMLTIAAICAGLTAIKSGFHGHFERAVLFILAAAILDGLDGRIARLLGSESKMGAELDSLADFVNFGVAPGFLLFFWKLQYASGAAWIAVLIFAVCCVLRLARFNVSHKSEESGDGAYFVGVPAPAGALLVLLPMYIAFAFEDTVATSSVVVFFHMVFVGWLMISSIPTWSFKSEKVPRSRVQFFLVGFAVVGAAIFTNPWVTLIGLCVVYVLMVFLALMRKKNAATDKLSD